MPRNQVPDLAGAADPNYWRTLHMGEAEGATVHQQAKLLDVLAEIKYRKLQELMEGAQDMHEAKIKWWRKYVQCS